MDVLTKASQDYLKVIYGLTTSGQTVTNGLLARELGVSPPSVSAMVKRLAGEHLLQRASRRSLQLTYRGEVAALLVIRRQRLVETFLVQVLEMPWDEVHDEAALLEHALTDRLEQRIDAMLDYPTRDPHGDPIPPRHGRHQETWGAPLDSAPAGCRFRVERISDRDSAALRYLARIGIAPSVVIQVEDQVPFGGPRWIRLGNDRHALGGQLTGLLHGRVLEPAVDLEPAADVASPLTDLRNDFS